MTAITQLANTMDAEGREVKASQVRLSPTSIKITWTPPGEPKAYNGVIVVVSPQPLNPSNFPTDGVRYTASADWAAPKDMIGLAHVVATAYDNLLAGEVTLTNLPENEAIHAAVHLVNNVYGYYSPGTRTYPDDGLSVAYAGHVDAGYGPPTNPRLGQVYYNPDENMMYVWDGASWLTSKAHTALTGPVDPVPGQDGLPEDYPVIGSFFYNTTVKALKCWNGASWDESEPTRGEPMYQKLHIGTTGEPTARETIKSILRYQLGYPQVCVELVEEHFDIALNNALQELRRRTDSAYYKQYLFMTLLKHQNVYYLNDPTTGVDHVVDVLKIHRLNMMGLVNFGPDNIYAQQFLNQFYAPGVGYDLVSIHLIHSLSELYTQLFAGEVPFNWRETTRELKIYREFGHNEKVLLECSMEKPEQELLVDRWTQQWIQQWAEAELFVILANIRGKFANLPGPGGGLQLNADSLRSEAQRLQDDCLRQIRDFEVGQNGPDNWYSPFIMG